MLLIRGIRQGWSCFRIHLFLPSSSLINFIKSLHNVGTERIIHSFIVQNSSDRKPKNHPKPNNKCEIIFRIKDWSDCLIPFKNSGKVLQPTPATYGQRQATLLDKMPAYCRAQCKHLGFQRGTLALFGRYSAGGGARMPSDSLQIAPPPCLGLNQEPRPASASQPSFLQHCPIIYLGIIITDQKKHVCLIFLSPYSSYTLTSSLCLLFFLCILFTWNGIQMQTKERDYLLGFKDR